MMSMTLMLLQEAALLLGSSPAIPLERKAAGLLAFLALEGPTRRSRLAGLLWPDSGDTRARTNLRQALARLKRIADGIVEGADPLCLPPTIRCDLRDAAKALEEREVPDLAPFQAILPSFDFSDCPEFAEWLADASRRLSQRQIEVLELTVDHAEAAGDLGSALQAAARLVSLEPFSEQHHRSSIRLHYARGDRAAALNAYRRLETILAEELGTVPMPETRELRRLIEEGVPLAASGPPSLPAVILRPPRLVGRGEAWGRMERAWEEGKFIYLSGPAGVGKSRLASDFVRAKGGGQGLFLPSRPGDASVPFASQARAIRKTLAAAPDVRIEPWVRRELSRMLPDLREPDDGELPPLRERDARLRFFQAQVEFILGTGRGPLTVMVDDLQFTDEESVALGHFMVSALAGSVDVFRAVFTFRPDELSPSLARSVQELNGAGLGELIELQPLEPESSRTLLADLGIEGLVEESRALHALSGGNPAILLEAVKMTLHSGHGSLGASRGAWALLQRRLDSLRGEARDLARIAAVAGESLSPELAAAVLEVHPLQLVEAWKELESQQILQGTSLVHDLLKEAILSTIPVPLRSSLHRRIASYLELQGSDPIGIALHWEGAGMHERAAPYLLLER